MKTPITPEALIEMGFEQKGQVFMFNGFAIEVNMKSMRVFCYSRLTNATTIEDIKSLIRLFK